MGIVLPTKPIPATSTNPQYLVLYGLPKAGKTSAVAQLQDNLIIDLEGGSKFIDALAVQARTITDLGEIATRDVAKSEHPQGLSENMSVAKRGGTVAKSARDAYEKETKKIAVSKNNSIKYKYIEDKKLINKKRD